MEAERAQLPESLGGVALADELLEAALGRALVAVEAERALDRGEGVADRAPEVEGRLAVGVALGRDAGDLRLGDDHRHGARALGRLAGIGGRIERHVGGDDQRGLAAGGAAQPPLEGLAEREGPAVAGVLDLVAAAIALQPELLGDEGAERPAHVEGALGADHHQADVLEGAVPAAQRALGGAGGELHHAVAVGAEGHLVAAEAEGVLVGVHAAELGELAHVHGEGRELQADGGDAGIRGEGEVGAHG